MKKLSLALLASGSLVGVMVDDQVAITLKTNLCPKCNLVNVKVDGQNLDGAVFLNADLRDSTFTYEEMLEPDGVIEKVKTSLKNANFRGAHLEGTRFIEVDLSGADFEGATFDARTEFIDCTLKGAKMSSKALTFKDAKGKEVKVKGAFGLLGKPKFVDIDNPAKKK